MPVRNDFVTGEFCWTDLVSHDLNAAVAWYSSLFGWSHSMMESPPGSPPYAFFTKGEAIVGGVGEMDDAMKAQGIPPMWNSYINTEDCSAFEAKVSKLGGRVTVPTMEVPGHGKLAFFLDPEGASFAAWQSTNAASPGSLVEEPGAIVWHELLTRDSNKASEFYGALAGWDLVSMPMGDIDYTMAKCEGKDAAGIFSMQGPQFEGIPAHWMVYMAVEDCDATAKNAEESGGTITVPPTEIPIGKFACLLDPQGASFAIITINKGNC